MTVRSRLEAKWGSDPLWPGWDRLDRLPPREQINRLSMAFGRNAWPELLFDWWYSGLLSVDDLRSVLPDAWCRPEFPQSHLGVEQWVEFFRTAGFVSDQGRERPTAPFVVHRGASWGRRRGMAWTTDGGKARWFADRYNFDGTRTVFTVTVHPDAVLALFDGRDEAEVIVDPALLPPVRRPVCNPFADPAWIGNRS